MKTKLNQKTIQILDAIHLGGGKNVRLSANELGQNKNFYFRVTKLKNLCYISVQNVSGEKSYYTLTDDGYNALIAAKTEHMNDCLEKIGMPRI